MKLGLLVYLAVRGWLPLIEHESKAAGVEWLTLAAIVAIESHGNHALVGHEKNGSCSVGLGMVNVPDCDPARIAALKDPATNIRASARVLRATGKWCRRHPSDRCCRAGERLFAGGGGVNRYAGNSTTYAKKVQKWRRALRAELTRRRSK